MMLNLLSRASVALNRLFLPLCLLFCAALAYHHYQLIAYPIPLDRNEAGMLSITATIAAGENPYSLQNQPMSASVYPVLYNMVVAPLSLAFGNTLFLHRTVVGIFIAAACCLLFFVTRRASGSPRYSLAAAALFYAGLLYYSTPIASPNSTGILLFLLSIFVPWYCAFSNRSLLAALVLGVLAFYGKQYFIASLGYISLYLFLAVSKKRALLFGVCSLLAFAASIAVVNYTSPYFLDNTFFSVKYATGFAASDEALYKQFQGYSQIYLPVLAIVMLLVIVKLWDKSRCDPVAREAEHNRRGFLNIGGMDLPLINRPLDYIWFCLACSLVVIFTVGDNKGNYLTYLFQFLSPFLLVGTFTGVSKLDKSAWLAQLLVMVAFYNNYTMLSHDFSVDEKGWARLQQEIASGKVIYGSTLTLVEIVTNGGEVYQNGHTPYTRFAMWKPAYLKRDNPEERAEGVWETYVARICAMIEAQEFDLIILDERTKLPKSLSDPQLNGLAYLKKYYRRREVIPLSLANRHGGGKLNMQIWEPKQTRSQ